MAFARKSLLSFPLPAATTASNTSRQANFFSIIALRWSDGLKPNIDGTPGQGELRTNGHRALVFSQFVDHLSILRQHLDSEGVGYQYPDGSTPPKARQAAVDAF